MQYPQLIIAIGADGDAFCTRIRLTGEVHRLTKKRTFEKVSASFLFSFGCLYPAAPERLRANVDAAILRRVPSSNERRVAAAEWSYRGSWAQDQGRVGTNEEEVIRWYTNGNDIDESPKRANREKLRAVNGKC